MDMESLPLTGKDLICPICGSMNVFPCSKYYICNDCEWYEKKEVLDGL